MKKNVKKFRQLQKVFFGARASGAVYSYESSFKNVFISCHQNLLILACYEHFKVVESYNYGDTIGWMGSLEFPAVVRLRIFRFFNCLESLD